MPNKPVRIIIDTNLWISFLITKNYSKLDKLIFSGKCDLLISEGLLKEFFTVVKKPKFNRFFSTSDIVAMLRTVEKYVYFIHVEIEVNICRDPRDNFCWRWR
jgi:putative PIN family toxin of toxin-antitoxin system